MSEEQPIWRQAIKDEQHPLHRAAWILFGKTLNLKSAEPILSAQQDDVVAFCNVILDTDELYKKSALGGGNAPIHAVQLLCHWKVEAAIPRLLRILNEEDWDAGVYGTTADAIAAFGATIVDPLLEMAAQKEKEQEKAAIAGTLADAAPGDPRTIEFIRKIFDGSTEDFEIIYMAENVITGDPEGGVKWLESRLRTRKYSKETRKRIEKYIDDAKAGRF